MPTRADILLGLATIANRAMVVAVLWHLVLAAVLVGLLGGARPSRRRACMLLTLPLLSVSVAAYIFNNPFNGSLFALGAVVLAVLARNVSLEPIAKAARWSYLTGATLLAFGWVYPHFLTMPAAAYLVAAPVGLLPCPTLCVVIGFALLGGGLGPRTWQLTLAALGLFYGLFGTLRLGVWIDAALLAGAFALAVNARAATD